MTECAVATAATPPGGGPVKEEMEEETPTIPEERPHAHVGRNIEVVEPTSPDTAMAERIKVERADSPEIRITDSPHPAPPTTTSSASSPASTSSAFAKSPIGSPAAAAVSSAAGSPQPSLPSPPLLFQPFLPSADKNAAGAVGAKSGTLPFSIDNILKPSFGHRLQLLQTVAVAAAAAAHRQQQEQQQRQQQQQGLFTSDRLAEHLATSQPPPPPPRLLPASNGGPTNPGLNNNNRPVDLSRSKPTAPPSPEKKPDSAGSPLPLKKEDDGDCPPGMVRGPNGQLWPAWVFCTRYSDRPSSGKRSNIWNFYSESR